MYESVNAWDYEYTLEVAPSTSPVVVPSSSVIGRQTTSLCESWISLPKKVKVVVVLC